MLYQLPQRIFNLHSYSILKDFLGYGILGPLSLSRRWKVSCTKKKYDAKSISSWVAWEYQPPSSIPHVTSAYLPGSCHESVGSGLDCNLDTFCRRAESATANKRMLRSCLKVFRNACDISHTFE